MTDERTDAELGPKLLGRFSKGELGRFLLVPGDPDRIPLLSRSWKGVEAFSLDRGYRGARGSLDGVAVTAISSGIGGASLEVLMVEAAALGIDTFIRVGTTGALQGGLRCGDLIINEASVRLDGTSASYVRPEFPAAASYEVTSALVRAARSESATHHVGVGATTSSFYSGQDRPSFKSFRSKQTEGLLHEMRRAGVLNFEMEAATLFTLARLFGLRAGAVCSVIAHRITGEWNDAGGVERSCRVANRAIWMLAQPSRAASSDDQRP